MTSLVHPVDIGILAVFLLINLIVGLSYGRKVVTLEDYATGGRNFSTATLTATVVATWITGSFLLSGLEYSYTRGLYYTIASIIGGFMGIYLTGRIGGRMGDFLGKLSVPEVIGDMYGKKARLFSAMSSMLNLIGWLAVQFEVITRALSLLLGLEGPLVTVVAAAIVITYSALGGIRSVTFTDVVQFVTFGIFIPTIALMIWNNLPNSGELVYKALATTPRFNLREVVGFTPEFMTTISLIFFFSIPAIAPELFQRITMASSAQQAKRSFTYATFIVLIIRLFVIWIAILLLADNATLSREEVLPYLVNKHAYAGFRGVFGVGIVAMAMSSADSFLNTAAVIVSNDIIVPLESNKRRRLLIARYSTLFIGMAALPIALYSKDLLKMALLSTSIYAPVVTVPLILATFGFRTTPKVGLFGMAAGLLTVVLWSIYGNNSDSIAPGMFANLIALLGSHYLLGEKGGWVKKKANNLPTKALTTRKREGGKSFRLKTYLRQNLPTNEGVYFYFGLYILFAIYTACYTIACEHTEACPTIFKAVCYTVPLLASSFMIFPLLVPSAATKRFIIYCWPVGIGISLFVSNTLLAIISHFSPIQTVILMINILIATSLLRWQLALCLAAGGIVLSTLCFTLTTGSAIPVEALGALWYKIGYMVLLFVVFLIVLIKHKSAYRQLAAKNQGLAAENNRLLTRGNEEKAFLLEVFKDRVRLLQAIKQADVANLSKAANLIKQLYTRGKRSVSEKSALAKGLAELKETITPTAIQLDRIESRASEYMQLAPALVRMDMLLAQVGAACKEQTLHLQNNSQHTQLFCDPNRIKKVLVNSIHVLQTNEEEPLEFYIALEDTKLTYEITSMEHPYTKKVDALAFTITTDRAMFAPDHASEPLVEREYPAQLGEAYLVMPGDNQELLLLTNQQIIKAHYGYTDIAPKAAQDTHVYVIPMQLEEVRSKDLDLPCMALGAQLVRADDTYPGAKEQENALLAAVEKYPKVDIETVKTAIEMIKWYHGPTKRESGEPFYLHPIAVAQIVLDYNQDQPTLLAALLHDTVEDTPMLLEHIELSFDAQTARIVDGVTHLESNKDAFHKVKLTSAENLYKLLHVKDQRSFYVKLADRVHNLRTIKAKPYKTQRKIADETLKFFVPLAEKCGLPTIAEELKAMSMEVVSRGGVVIGNQ